MPYILHRGDCLPWLSGLDDESADGAITDPPYSSGGRTNSDKRRSTTKKYQVSGTAKQYPDFLGDSRSQFGSAYWMALWLAELYRILRPGSPVLLFSDWRQLVPAILALEAGGFVFQGVRPWDKTEACRPRLGGFSAQCEFVIWGSRGQLVPDRLSGHRQCLDGITRCGVGEKYHVTEKPARLMDDLIEIMLPGQVVIDPFAGAGGTGLAALRRGCIPWLAELSPEYAAIAKGRLEAQLANAPYDPEGRQTTLFRS